MSEQKRYTAQEMRDTACRLFGEIGFNDPLVEHTVCKAEAMLRQAADAEEELERVRLEALDTLKKYTSCINELTQAHVQRDSLKTRLKAVVKDNETMTDRMLKVIDMCNKMKDDFSSWNHVAADFAQKVLRAARGEGGAE